MKLKGVILVLCAGAGLLWAIRPTGYQETRITEFTKPVSLSVRAPWIPFRSGAVMVEVEGEISGEGELLVCEHESEEPQRIRVFGPKVFYRFGGAENWSDRVKVTFLPKGIREGSLELRVYCGVYPKPVETKPEQGVSPIQRPVPE
jgi:hypothetical protein